MPRPLIGDRRLTRAEVQKRYRERKRLSECRARVLAEHSHLDPVDDADELERLLEMAMEGDEPAGLPVTEEDVRNVFRAMEEEWCELMNGGGEDDDSTRSTGGD
jgi:hypothetical protein